MRANDWMSRVSCPTCGERAAAAGDIALGICGRCGAALRFAPRHDGRACTGRGGPWRFSPWVAASYRPELDPGTSIRVVEAPHVAAELGVRRAWLVDCTTLGTGTFKDLEAQVTLAASADLGVERLSVYSTGNTARAYHEWAKRVDAACQVVVPSAHADKLRGCVATDRQPIVMIDDPPTSAGDTAASLADSWGATRMGQGWRLEGPATLAYAMAESCPEADVIVQTMGSGFGPLGYELGFARAAAIAPFADAPIVANHSYMLFQPADAAIVAAVWADPRGVPDVRRLPRDPFEPTLQSAGGPATIDALRRLPVRHVGAVDPERVHLHRRRVDGWLNDAGLVLDFAREKATHIALTGLLGVPLDPSAQLAIVVTGAAPFD